MSRTWWATTSTSPRRPAGEGGLTAEAMQPTRIAVDASGRRSALARRQRSRRLALDALVGAYKGSGRGPSLGMTMVPVPRLKLARMTAGPMAPATVLRADPHSPEHVDRAATRAG